MHARLELHLLGLPGNWKLPPEMVAKAEAAWKKHDECLAEEREWTAGEIALHKLYCNPDGTPDHPTIICGTSKLKGGLLGGKPRWAWIPEEICEWINVPEEHLLGCGLHESQPRGRELLNEALAEFIDRQWKHWTRETLESLDEQIAKDEQDLKHARLDPDMVDYTKEQLEWYRTLRAHVSGALGVE